MKVKTRELIGPALDWAVAKCEESRGLKLFVHPDFPYVGYEMGRWCPTTDWGQGGPIIDDKEITIDYRDNETEARRWKPGEGDFVESRAGKKQGLLAAMRCYVASELGEEVEIPNDLIKES